MPLAKILYGPLWFKERLRVGSAYCRKFEDLEKRFERPMSQVRTPHEIDTKTGHPEIFHPLNLKCFKSEVMFV